MLKGADIVLKCLRGEGVDLVFGYPGGAICLCMTRSRAAACGTFLRVMSRARYSRRRLCAVHGRSRRRHGESGPGATNLVTGIADAKMDSVPLVCITGQVRSALIGTMRFRRLTFSALRSR